MSWFSDLLKLKMKEDWTPLCGNDNKVFEEEPWNRGDFMLKNRSQQNTEIYKEWLNNVI